MPEAEWIQPLKPLTRMRSSSPRLPRTLLAGAMLVGACTDAPRRQVAGGDPELGPALIRQYGCHSCHVIPGVEGADKLVGPPLIRWSGRVYIAGQLPNTPDNLVRWIMDPQAVHEHTAMPDMGVSEAHARHIAAYLFTLR